jgi:glycosyltransferase involved in cell wall biosynthesis
MSENKVIVVLPAYNAEKTIAKTVADIPREIVDEIILVDDASQDKTAELARNLGLTVVQHSKNRGYGANQKTCYDIALEHAADIVVMLHPDYQYDPRVIAHMIGFIRQDICDVILGNRIRTRTEALNGGMPRWKYFINRLSSILENFLFGQNLGEWHSGLRAYSRKVLTTIPYSFNTDDFAFDQQFLMQCVYFGFRLGDVPVTAHYFRDSSSINLRRSIKYGLQALETIVRYYLKKWLGVSFGIFSLKK